jgi:hypothetical protein
LALPYYGVGCTHKFRDVLMKDGAVYNLGAAVVKYVLTDPAGVAVEKAATVEDAISGLASYTTLTTDLTATGTWQFQWKVTDGGTVLKSRPKSFKVGV